MFQIFSRISWILAIIIAIAIFAIDEDLFIFAVIAGIFVRFFLLSDAFIHERVRFFADKISERKPQEKSLVAEKKQEKKSSTIAKEDVTLEHQNTALEESNVIKKEPKEPGVIKKFFSENILAKLGGILVFLGVLFFLSLIYSIIGPVAKMGVGFMIAFGCFAGGMWLQKKGFKNEGVIVMGTAILVNYLVILSGRYLLGDDSSTDATLLSVTTTFIFLILNTVFAVSTALVYNSRTLLVFSFIFAYINPIIAGGSADEPYTLLGYTMIVTLGAMYMSFQKKDNILFPLSFLFAAFLFLIAPWHDSLGWIAKLLSINILGAMSLYVSTEFKKSYRYIHELLIGGTFFLIGTMGFLGIHTLSPFELGILGGSSLGLMGFCYLFMHRGMYLYSIGTLGSILTLSPALVTSGTEISHITTSIIIIGVFTLMNLSAILLKSKDLLENKNTGNITIGLISGAAFLTSMVYLFGNEYFPGMMQGFAFLGLAVIYSLLSFVIVQKIGFETLQKSPENKNIFYAVSGIGLSLFTLAIAFVFAEHKEIISIVWLLEATVLFYLSNKINSYKISLGALVLFVIGVMRILPFLDTKLSGQYGMIVGICIMTLIFLYNTYVLYSSKKDSLTRIEIRTIHNIFHIIGVGTVTLMLYDVIENRLSDWESFWYFATSVTLFMIFYAHIGAVVLRIFSSGIYGLFLIAHVLLFMIEIAFGNTISAINLLISSCMVITFALPYIYERVSLKKLKLEYILPFYLIYLLAISTLYVYHFFPTTFSITLYWGILGSLLLGHGIRENIMRLRTLGLYLIILTAGKIFFYDIWVGVNDVISRVVALMVVGILMIILSTMYTRKYGNTLNSEFRPSNLFPKKTHKNTYEKKSQKTKVQQDIESINIDDISSVRMIIQNDKTFQIRSENLIKIAKLIQKSYGKNEFEAGELEQAYTMISQNYKSSLSPSQYKRIKEIVKLFVDKGGSIELIKK